MFFSIYGTNNRPSETTIGNTIHKVETQFILLDHTRSIKIHPAHSVENRVTVALSVRIDLYNNFTYFILSFVLSRNYVQ